MITTCLHERTLPLKRSMRTAQGLIRLRRVFVLVIQDSDGNSGYGEAAPLPAMGGEDPMACREALEHVIPRLPSYADRWLANARPDGGLGPLERPLRHAPCARSCVESALLSLLAARRNISLAALLAGDGPVAESLAVNALLAGDDPEELAEAASRLVAGGWRSLKLKVGSEDPSADANKVKTLREWVGDRVSVRVDANAGWTLEQAQQFLNLTREYRLEYIEQPLPADDIEGLAKLRKLCGVPIAVDESIRDAGSIGRIAAKQAADIVILKPMALGGWRLTRQVAKLAHDTGMGVVVTTFLDGSIGRAIATHIASVLPIEGRAQGLGTGPLLTADLTDSPILVEEGAVQVPEQPGLGVGTLLPEVVSNE